MAGSRARVLELSISSSLRVACHTAAYQYPPLLARTTLLYDTMDESTMELMSRDEECCLKTALAFAVLRKRLEQQHENDDAAPPPAYLGGLMGNTIPSLPCSNTTTDHVSKMMNLAISTAMPLCSNTIPINDSNKRASALQTLEGMTQHLALQLRNATTTVSMEWLTETLSKKHEIVAVSLVWHLILQAEPSVGALLLPAVGQVLQHLYHSYYRYCSFHGETPGTCRSKCLHSSVDNLVAHTLARTFPCCGGRIVLAHCQAGLGILCTPMQQESCKEQCWKQNVATLLLVRSHGKAVGVQQ